MKDERKYTYVSTVAYQGEFDYIFYLDFFSEKLRHHASMTHTYVHAKQS